MEVDQNQQSSAQQGSVPQQPINKIPSPRSKWKLILLIIILLIIVGSGTYLLGIKQNRQIAQDQQKTITPTTTQSASASTPDPTTNWKTYVSKNYGYEIKYPLDWRYGAGVMSEGFNKDFVKDSDNFTCGFLLSTIDTNSFDSYLKNDREIKKQNSVLVKTSEIVNNNNVLIVKDESSDSVKKQGIYASYFIKNGKGKYSYQIYASIDKNIVNKDGISTVYGTVNDQNCLNIFDQMLSTFKFTDQSEAIDTSSWKTYVSATEKASFKYPQDWILSSSLGGDLPDQDRAILQSPSGKVKITWISAFTGLGGNCEKQVQLGGYGACPLVTIVNKAVSSSASDLFVVSGTITTDGKIYEPFLAVEDSKGILTTQQTMPYISFAGRNNGRAGYVDHADVLFSTSAKPQAEGPRLSQSEATAWFDNPEVQQAKLILLSFTYQQ